MLEMLKLYESTKEMGVMSLRTGGPVASLGEPIINPNNLFIEGWHVRDSRTNENLVLLSQDVRDVLPQGLVINDHEVLAEPEELVRLKEIMGLNFRLSGLRVTTVGGKSYGKVSDFAFETSSFYVQKVYASQSLVKNFTGGMNSIDRSQIVEITNRRLVIEDPTEQVTANAPAPA